MKKINKILLFFFSLVLIANAALASDDLLEPKKEFKINNEYKEKDSTYFNLANIVDGLLLNEQKETPEVDNKSLVRKEFIQAGSKFNQGNALSAYSDYESLIDKIDNDMCLLSLAKIFYEIGFFSLGDKASDKIITNIRFKDIIFDLKTSYKPSYNLSKEEEIAFAKHYSNIYFNLSAQETINELLKAPQKQNDYYNYVLSRAYFEQKQYSKALSSINKAISINNKNISYQIFKIDSLIALKKYNDAKNLIEKLERDKNLISFLDDIKIKKETVLAYLANKESEKKYHLAYSSYKEGNFEKTKKDCLNILNFDKDNAKVLSLYAKAELASGAVERAGTYFINSYKIEKNNIDTLIGLGDVRFIHGDYKNSAKAYKKALKKDKTNYEIILKLHNAKRHLATNPKELQKLEALLDKTPKSAYIDYYRSAISIAQKNSVLKEEYLKRSLEINPVFEHALGELIELNLKNKNYKAALGLIYNTSFTLEKNYYYYYLLGLYNQAVNKPQEAISFYKTSLNLNPNFEIANIKLLNLIPDKMQEEI